MLQCFQNPDVLRRTSGQLQNTTPVTQMLNIIMLSEVPDQTVV